MKLFKRKGSLSDINSVLFDDILNDENERNLKVEKRIQELCLCETTHVHLLERYYSVIKKEYQETFLKLKQSNENPVMENDIWWNLYLKKREYFRLEENWTSFKNVSLLMGKLVKEEKRLKHALSIYLEVAFIELNIQHEISCITFHEIKQLMETLHYSTKECKVLYTEWMELCYENSPFTFQSEASWFFIEDAIKIKK